MADELRSAGFDPAQAATVAEAEALVLRGTVRFEALVLDVSLPDGDGCDLEAFMAQVSQTAACNSRHNLVQRLARWLLMAHDRVDGDELALTQEFLSKTLAVRRPGVTISMQSLQIAGAVSQGRGRILVCDRPGLEAASCGCYGRVRAFAEAVAASSTDQVRRADPSLDQKLPSARAGEVTPTCQMPERERRMHLGMGHAIVASMRQPRESAVAGAARELSGADGGMAKDLLRHLDRAVADSGGNGDKQDSVVA